MCWGRLEIHLPLLSPCTAAAVSTTGSSGSTSSTSSFYVFSTCATHATTLRFRGFIFGCFISSGFFPGAFTFQRLRVCPIGRSTVPDARVSWLSAGQDFCCCSLRFPLRRSITPCLATHRWLYCWDRQWPREGGASAGEHVRSPSSPRLRQ